MDERNDIIETEEGTNETEEGTNEGSGIGTGLAMLIGAGLTVAGIAIGKKVKKALANHKAKKELKEEILDDVDYAEVED